MTLYTPESANALLPAVAVLVERLRDAQATMEARTDQVRTMAPTNGGGPAHREFVAAARVAATAARALHDLDIEVRDPEQGLIDFPAERDGRETFLCWRLGEERVGFWHPRDSGFAGRAPL